MDSTEVYKKLTPIFRDVFENNTVIPHPAMTSAEVEDWDSLSNIRLIISIEENFEISFDIGEVVQLNNVGELVAIIQKKLALQKVDV